MERIRRREHNIIYEEIDTIWSKIYGGSQFNRQKKVQGNYSAMPIFNVVSIKIYWILNKISRDDVLDIFKIFPTLKLSYRSE